MIFVELALLLLCIVVGARLGGIGLGTVGGIGVAILVFGFGLPPGAPPRTVLGMILCVITATASMQAAGGLDWLVSVAEKALSARPRAITFVAPAVVYLLVVLGGTAHIVYALLPIIAEVSRKAGVRPERPLSISAITSIVAVTASPISAASVALLGFVSPMGFGLKEILLIVVPSTFLGCMLGALAVSRVGRELADDPEYQRRLRTGELVETATAGGPGLDAARLRRARGSVLVFIGAALVVVALGLVPSLRPEYSLPVAGGGERVEQLELAPAIMMTMLAAAGLNMLLFGATAKKTLESPVMSSGIVALVSIAGLAWMGSAFFDGNRPAIVGGISRVVGGAPWLFAVGLFALSMLLSSQAATVTTLVPVGVALGLSGLSLVAMFPATAGYFVLPTYGTIVAATSFDRTGTTRIGKYVVNHSFLLPGLVTVVSSLLIGFGIAALLGR
jgi:anaerobic C4-dicarboxylate transporter DcuA